MSSLEMKELLRLIVPNYTEDNTDFEDIADYIKKLGSSSLEHALKEPAVLSEEKKTITEQTQELAFTNYKTFVDTADTSQIIMKDFGKSKDSLEKFLTALPSFIDESEKFSASASKILKEKSRYTNIRNQSDKLLELLELPALMREALAAEDYESALDLFTFVRNLSRRYAEIPLVQNTTSEIMTLWFETLYHLFNQLRYDLPLPQCLQILGYLRRANTVYKSTDEEHAGPGRLLAGSKASSTGDGLHLHFLKARSAWFENALEDIKNTESSDKVLRRTVELHRIHLFNVLTQHKSIFLSDSQEPRARDDELNGTAALSCWLKQKIALLSDILNRGLSKEDEASFESLFNQCMYLCLSFGRVGADMRCVLTPLFRNHLLAYFHRKLEKTDVQFENEMRTYKLPHNMRNLSKPTESTQSGPPESLLDYYPLAEYCNGLLILLNSLRVTAPLNIVRDIYEAFRASFERVVQTLIAFYQREQQAFTEPEKQNFIALCVCFSDDLMPYIVKCLALTFPSALIAEHLGITLSALQESKILYINQVNMYEPLSAINGLINK